MKRTADGGVGGGTNCTKVGRIIAELMAKIVEERRINAKVMAKSMVKSRIIAELMAKKLVRHSLRASDHAKCESWNSRKMPRNMCSIL